MDPVLLALLLERLAWACGVAAVSYGFLQRNEWAWVTLKAVGRWGVNRWPGRETNRKLDLVLSQLYPNGGGSLFDLMARNEQSLGQIRRHLAIVEAQSHGFRDSIGMLAYTTNSQGAHVQSSRPLLELVGMTPQEATGLGWKNCIAPEDLSHYAASWASAVADGRDFLCDVRLRNVRTGALIPVRVAANAVTLDGQLVGWMGHIERREP